MLTDAVKVILILGATVVTGTVLALIIVELMMWIF